MSLETAYTSLAKTQRRIAGEYAAEIKAGLHAKRVDEKRTEISRLRKAVKENLNWARRERETT
jgi:hypothetical protein